MPPLMSPGVEAHTRRVRRAAMLMAGFLLGFAVLAATSTQWCGAGNPTPPAATQK